MRLLTGYVFESFANSERYKTYKHPVYCGDCLRALLIQKDTKQRVEAVYRMEV